VILHDVDLFPNNRFYYLRLLIHQLERCQEVGLDHDRDDHHTHDIKGFKDKMNLSGKKSL